MKNLEVKPGKYIVAVSGGVDSMVLLDLLTNKKNLELVVAHFDHGIRKDSHIDAALVKQAAKTYGLVFELGKGNLGKGASEEQAREARYKFLYEIKSKHKADGIITAHQRDDVIETALINIIRGTGPKGLSALISSKQITRPLLNYPKNQIKAYAVKNKITWHEDSTNKDVKYLRNKVREMVTSKLTEAQKDKIIANIDKVAIIQDQKEEHIAKISQSIKKNELIDRQLFTLLPKEVGAELVANWLRHLGHNKFDKKTIDKVNLNIRTGLSGTRYDISNDLELVVDKFFAKFK